MQTLKSLLKPKTWWILLAPLCLAVCLWIGIFWFLAPEWVRSLLFMMEQSEAVASLESWLGVDLSWLLGSASAVIFFVLFFVLIYCTALALTSWLVMPLLMRDALKNEYADLQLKKGGSLGGSVRNMVGATIVYLLVLAVTLPLWLIPGAGLVISLVLIAWVSRKVFTYDSLQDVASAEEMETFTRQEKKPLFLLGLLLATLNFIPLASLFAPTLVGLAYMHYCLLGMRHYRSKMAAAKIT